MHERWRNVERREDSFAEHDRPMFDAKNASRLAHAFDLSHFSARRLIVFSILRSAYAKCACDERYTRSKLRLHLRFSLGSVAARPTNRMQSSPTTT
jgi:hypothetical protein